MYPAERKQAVLAKLCPPNNRSVPEVAAEEGISEATLYSWRRQARERGELYPNAGTDAEGWRARDKYAAVVETAAMNESERSEYCRQRGLYPQQLEAWRSACEQANDWDEERQKEQARQSRGHVRRIRELERELRRKEKALAETAALLTLSKKARAIWGDGEDEYDQRPGSPTRSDADRRGARRRCSTRESLWHLAD
jgi:transposase-like protein